MEMPDAQKLLDQEPEVPDEPEVVEIEVEMRNRVKRLKRTCQDCEKYPVALVPKIPVNDFYTASFISF